MFADVQYLAHRSCTAFWGCGGNTQVYGGPTGMILLPSQDYMRSYDAAALAKRKDHVFIVSHVHVHPHKLGDEKGTCLALFGYCMQLLRPQH